MTAKECLKHTSFYTKDEFFTRLSFQLKYYRHKKQLTVRDMAEKLNISPASVSRYEKNPANMKLETLFLFLIMAGLGMGVLFPESEEPGEFGIENQ